jgi:hypothetical protein
VPGVSQQDAEHAPLFRTKRSTALIAFAIVCAAIGWGLIEFAAHWPFSRAAFTQSLESALNAKIAIQDYKETYFPPGCIAQGVTVTLAGAREPISVFRKFSIEASYPGLLAHQFSRIVLDGAVVSLPSVGSLSGLTTGKAPQVVVGEIIADGSVLQVDGNRFDFRRLKAQNVGSGRAIVLDFDGQIPKPPGELAMKANVGPFTNTTSAQLPLSGSYTFKNAKLDVFQNLRGTLSSNGSFNGVLSRLNVSGSTDTPDFEVNGNGHQHHLKMDFRASVDGLNGDTTIESFRATLDQTTMTGHASVMDVGGQQGKTVSVEVSSGRGRVEDLLLLAVHEHRAPLLGSITFTAHAVVPPDDRRFTEKISGHSVFEITGARFANPTTQQSVASLSEEAEGEPRDAPEAIREQVQAQVSVGDGVATFANILVRIPGAKAELSGPYNLITERVNLHGKSAMEAELSQTTTGIKSFFLKFLDPFYKGKHAGAVVPVGITGTYHHPVFQVLTVKKKK